MFDEQRLGNDGTVSVPKILTLFIPEILSHPAIAGRDRTLPMPPVGRPGRREEDVRNVKASRSRDSVEGRSPQDRRGFPCARLSALPTKLPLCMSMMLL